MVHTGQHALLQLVHRARAPCNRSRRRAATAALGVGGTTTELAMEAADALAANDQAVR